MSKKIILIRHAETELNRLGSWASGSRRQESCVKRSMGVLEGITLEGMDAKKAVLKIPEPEYNSVHDYVCAENRLT